MGREAANTRSLADAPDHPHERLVARRLLRILAPPRARVGVHPLLNLDGEPVVVEIGRELPVRPATLAEDVGIQRKPIPMLAFTPGHGSGP